MIQFLASVLTTPNIKRKLIGSAGAGVMVLSIVAYVDQRNAETVAQLKAAELASISTSNERYGVIMASIYEIKSDVKIQGGRVWEMSKQMNTLERTIRQSVSGTAFLDSNKNAVLSGEKTNGS